MCFTLMSLFLALRLCVENVLGGMLHSNYIFGRKISLIAGDRV